MGPSTFIRCYRWRQWVNTSRPIQNGRRFAGDTFKHIFLNENVGLSIKPMIVSLLTHICVTQPQWDKMKVVILVSSWFVSKMFLYAVFKYLTSRIFRGNIKRFIFYRLTALAWCRLLEYFLVEDKDLIALNNPFPSQRASNQVKANPRLRSVPPWRYAQTRTRYGVPDLTNLHWHTYGVILKT